VVIQVAFTDGDSDGVGENEGIWPMGVMRWTSRRVISNIPPARVALSALPDIIWGTVTGNKSEPLSEQRISYPHHLENNRMPPQCSILGSIAGNHQFNCELTPYMKGKVVSLCYDIEIVADWLSYFLDLNLIEHI
jgi:hypothetical protein